MFRYKSSIHVNYNRQGYVYFTSLLYKSFPERERQKIDKLCLDAAGGRDSYALALREFVTTNTRAEIIENRYNISKSTLYRIVREYYCRFPLKL